MSIIKPKKVRELNDKEMGEKLRELHLEFSKEMASSEIGGSVKNPGRIREIKRTIARIKTESGRRQRTAADSKRKGD